MHSSSSESGPSSRRLDMSLSPSSSSPMTDNDHEHSNTDSGSGYSSDPEHDHDHDQDSPTESDKDFMSSLEDFSPGSKPSKPSSSSSKHIHVPPSSSSSSGSGSPVESKPLASRYPRIFNNHPSSNSNLLPNSNSTPSSNRPNRVRGLSPLSTLNASSQNTSGHHNEFQPRLPKAQPLSRALFNKSLSDTPHSGLLVGGKKKTSQKVIVPTKAFRTTFELGLSASELARRA